MLTFYSSMIQHLTGEDLVVSTRRSILSRVVKFMRLKAPDYLLWTLYGHIAVRFQCETARYHRWTQLGAPMIAVHYLRYLAEGGGHEVDASPAQFGKYWAWRLERWQDPWWTSTVSYCIDRAFVPESVSTVQAHEFPEETKNRHQVNTLCLSNRRSHLVDTIRPHHIRIDRCFSIVTHVMIDLIEIESQFLIQGLHE